MSRRCGLLPHVVFCIWGKPIAPCACGQRLLVRACHTVRRYIHSMCWSSWRCRRMGLVGRLYVCRCRVRSTCHTATCGRLSISPVVSVWVWLCAISRRIAWRAASLWVLWCWFSSTWCNVMTASKELAVLERVRWTEAKRRDEKYRFFF